MVERSVYKFYFIFIERQNYLKKFVTEKRDVPF